MKTLLRLLALAWPLRWWMVLAAFLGFCTVAFGTGLMATSAYLISEAALHPSVAALGVAIVGVRFFGIFRGVFRYLERCVSHYVALGLLAKLRVWFYDAVEPLAPARLMSYKSGDLLTRVVADITTLQDFYVRVLAPPLVAVLVAIGMWLFLGAFDPVFAFILLGFYLISAVGLPWLTHRLSNRLGREIVQVRAELNVQLLDGIQGIAEIVAFGQEARFEQRMQLLDHKLIASQKRMAWVNGLQSALGTALMNLAMWTMLLVAVPMVRDGRLNGVYLAVILLATLASFEAVLPLPSAIQNLGGSLEAARRLFEIVDAAPPVHDPLHKPETPNSNARSGRSDSQASASMPWALGLSIRDLAFRYDPGGPPVLDQVSLDLPRGRCLALVGPSGAGKSTLANILLRFWDYEEGQIILGGRELKEYEQDEVRRLISVVSQRTHLFNTTIRGNLLIAKPGATEEELVEATRQAQIADFIRSLPKGLDTEVGEQGLLLSGGERQRLAIARAFLKDAPILILDEPTANLDALSEREVLRAVRNLVSGRTTLIITHRLTGLQIANEIAVMREGRIVERGTEQALIQQRGLYYAMWQLQRMALYSPEGEAVA